MTKQLFILADLFSGKSGGDFDFKSLVEAAFIFMCLGLLAWGARAMLSPPILYIAYFILAIIALVICWRMIQGM